MAAPLAGWLRPWLPGAFGGSGREEPNAAAVYRKAFGWAKGLRSEDRERLRGVATMPFDDRHLDTLLQRAGPALDAIQNAAAISRCDWGREILTDDDLNKDHVEVSSTLNVIRVACLSARRHARSGRGKPALDDLFAGLTLAHRLGTGQVLIARVLECSGEVTAIQTLGRILPDLEPVSLEDLARRLDALPVPESAAATIGPESRYVVGSLRAKLLAHGPIVEGEAWGEIGFGEEEAATLKRLTGGERAKLLAHLDATGPAFAELARRLDLPRTECRPALDEFARAARSTQPVVAELVEAAWGGRHMVDRMLAVRSMLRAGLALVRGGESAFRTVADPFGSGPFGLEPRRKGYLIRSAMSDEAKPELTLAIGDAA
jgi:hypothetical protein